MKNGFKTSPWLILLLAALLMALPACGDDTSGDKGGIIGGNNRPDATGDVFAPDAQDDVNGPDDDAQGGDADVEEDTNNGPPPTGVFCEATNLGMLGDGDTKTVTADFANATSKVQPACKRGIAKEVVFRFTAEQRSRISASLGESGIHHDDWVLQINQGSCGQTERLACFNGMPQGFIAEAGVDYYLVLEPQFESTADPVELTVTADAIACSPAGDAECAGDDLLYCQSDFTQVTRTCAYGCSDDACNGDICQNAIPMDPSGTLMLQGSLEGFSNKFNFAGKNECFASGVSLTTNAPEVLVALNGLTTGQVVSVDASEAVGDHNDNAIFILKGCSSSAPTCVPGVGTDLETLEWTVTEDGDYTLVIDLISASNPDFAYKVTVN